MTRSEQKSAAPDGRSAHQCVGGFPVTIVRLDLREGRREVFRTVNGGASPSSCVGVVKVSADGRTVAYNAAEILSDLYLVRGVR
jgi:hypothetical protein